MAMSIGVSYIKTGRQSVRVSRAVSYSRRWSSVRTSFSRVVFVMFTPFERADPTDPGNNWRNWVKRPPRRDVPTTDRSAENRPKLFRASIKIISRWHDVCRSQYVCGSVRMSECAFVHTSASACVFMSVCIESVFINVNYGSFILRPPPPFWRDSTT